MIKFNIPPKNSTLIYMNFKYYFYNINVFFINPFKPEFTIVIFLHYKQRIAIAILDL